MALILQDSTGKQYKIAGLGEAGKSAYEFSKEAGYTGTEEEFAEDLNSIKNKQNKLTGAQGQFVAFTTENVAGAVAPPTHLVTISSLSGNEFDSTFTEVSEMVANGVIVIVEYNNSFYSLYSKNENWVAFTRVISTGTERVFIHQDNTLTLNEYDFAADNTTFEPTSTITSNNVQDAIVEVDAKTLTFGAQTVASNPDSWASDTTYPQYPLMASVPLAGVTSSYIPIVTFSVADAISGNLAPVADPYDGGIRIYAKEQPSATVNIASVVCIKRA